MPQPLEGLRILDFTHVVAGPLATHLLRLLGAEVIKVESPSGDPLRNYSLIPSERGMAPAFVGINSGKKSVVLDLKSDGGLAHAQRLMASSDVVIENFRPGVMDRLGLGFQAAKALRPGIVYCSVSGFGQDSPLRDHPAIDQIVQSLSGLMNVSGHEGDDPIRIGIPIVDTFTGVMAALATLSALLQRERFGGDGQMVDVAMLDTTLVMMLSVVNPFLLNGTRHVRTGNGGFSRAPTADTFPTAKGQITIGAVQEKQVQALLQALGLGGLTSDPRFADRDARQANSDALQTQLRDAFAARPAAEWGPLLAAAGVPAGEVLQFEDVFARGWTQARDLTLSIPFGDGEAEILNAGFTFAHGGPGHAEGPPTLGQHTSEILGD
ncbi:CaiB/BaiF CoA transferase family protein [Pseudoprimorskyibacter insulae]|uniref:Acetyl-CoA:oxalate CoA-transferase n=1 Tax=Pseudoprimorskyibacter insulae TaxID=1695997 RepID=A0A2R8AQL9_9RHOB|nr:CoA transferase [Pseudoprimorskyibacter insulae]SPF78124.1 Acetyl-CoA:oxalate CoA-transferase [Pseudoprimorskyibacter insulae]